jgi:hypothetical protein
VDEEQLKLDMELSDSGDFEDDEEEKAQPYSVGSLERPREDDDQFADLEEAEMLAMEQSRYSDTTMAVWDNESGEVLAIAYAGIVYTP